MHYMLIARSSRYHRTYVHVQYTSEHGVFYGCRSINKRAMLTSKKMGKNVVFFTNYASNRYTRLFAAKVGRNLAPVVGIPFQQRIAIRVYRQPIICTLNNAEEFLIGLRWLQLTAAFAFPDPR